MTQLPRSPELMSRHDTALLVVDVQEKLLPAIPDRDRLVWNIRRLIDGATLLGLPILATEQYPQGLGPTIPILRERLPTAPAKVTFSCRDCGDLFEPFRKSGVYKILVCGMETHVCIQQTVIDLMGEGFRVYIAADAVAARGALDHDIALRRMDSTGAVITTTESALFEWCETAGATEFKRISALIREMPPA